MSFLSASAPFVERLGWTLVHSVWQLTLIASLTMLLTRLLRRRTAGARYLILVSMLAVLAAAPVVTWCVLPVERDDRVSAADAAVSETPVAPEPVVAAQESEPFAAEAPAAVAATTRPETVDPVAAPIAAREESPAASLRSRGRAALQPWLNVIVAGWLVGVCLFAVRPALSFWTIQRLRRVGVSPVSDAIAAVLERANQRVGLRRAVTLLESSLARVPMVVGYVRPVILLPMSVVSGLPTSQVEAVLAHELAHIRRHDYLVNIVQTLIETVLFYHPAVWWLSHQIRIERENCCDDTAIKVTGSRLAYGQALLALENLRTAPPTLAVGWHGGSFADRVRRLLLVDSRPGSFNAEGLTGLAVAAIATAVAAWTVAVAGEAQETRWGNEVHGVTCRIVPVAASTDEAAIDMNQRVDTFADPDEITFAVELKNTGPEPVTLLGLRHGPGHSQAGRLNTSLLAPCLFEFEFLDDAGKPLPEAARRFTDGTMGMLLQRVSTHELRPDQSLKFLLRPARFERSMDHRLSSGRYRTRVRYRGPGKAVLEKLREYSRQPSQPKTQLWAHEVTSNEVAFAISPAADSPPPRLTWGAVKEGLQAALEIRVPRGSGVPTSPPGVPLGTSLQAVFHIRNVSDKPITFVSESPRQGDSVQVHNAAGEEVRVRDVWSSGVPIDVRWNLQPGDRASIPVLTPSLNDLDQPGQHTVRFTMRFRSRVQKDGTGNVVFPAPGDWQSNLETGRTPLFLLREPLRISANGEIHGRLTDDDTGEPIRGATVACGAVINDSRRGGGDNSVTDSAGKYRLQPPSPGIYVVWLKKHPRSSRATAVADDGILVEAGRIATSELRVTDPRYVTGRVVDPAGQPVEHIVVRCHSAARPESGSTQSVRTTAAGEFGFFLPPGRAYMYTLRTYKGADGNQPGIAQTADVVLNVPRTGRMELVLLTLQRQRSSFGSPEWLKRSTSGTEILKQTGAADVTGTVVDATGKPISGAQVFKVNGPIITTNEQGTFRVESDKGTQFVMHAFQPGYRVWFGTPTAGDELKIVLEKKTTEAGTSGAEPAAPPANRGASVPGADEGPDVEKPTDADRKSHADVIFRGLNLSALPSTTDPYALEDLYEENPPGSGTVKWHADTCFMAMPVREFDVYYRPRAGLFFVRREQGDTYTFYGPVKGNPLETLRLEPLLLESMKEFGTAGNAGLTMRRMVRSGNPELSAAGLRLMHRMLTDEAVLRSIDERAQGSHQAERNLDMVQGALTQHGDELRKAGIEGLTELEAAARSVGSRFTNAMPAATDSDYNDAAYLQKNFPAPESIRWGQESDGLRLGIAMSRPVVLTPNSDAHSARLYVRNVADDPLRFHLDGYVAEWVRIRVTDSAGNAIRTEFGDIPNSIPGFPTAWLLQPGHMLELCEIRLTWALPDAKVETTASRGMRVATTRLRAPAGRCRVSFLAPINFRRVLRFQGEWSGSLTSSVFTMHLIADDDEAPSASN